MSVPLCLCWNVFACLLCLSERFTGLISIAGVDDLSVRTHRSQIRSTRGRVALNSDADAKAEVSREEGYYCSEEAKEVVSRGVNFYLT